VVATDDQSIWEVRDGQVYRMRDNAEIEQALVALKTIEQDDMTKAAQVGGRTRFDNILKEKVESAKSLAKKIAAEHPNLSEAVVLELAHGIIADSVRGLETFEDRLNQAVYEHLGIPAPGTEEAQQQAAEELPQGSIEPTLTSEPQLIEAQKKGGAIPFDLKSVGAQNQNEALSFVKNELSQLKADIQKAHPEIDESKIDSYIVYRLRQLFLKPWYDYYSWAVAVKAYFEADLKEGKISLSQALFMGQFKSVAALGNALRAKKLTVDQLDSSELAKWMRQRAGFDSFYGFFQTLEETGHQTFAIEVLKQFLLLTNNDQKALLAADLPRGESQDFVRSHINEEQLDERMKNYLMDASYPELEPPVRQAMWNQATIKKNSKTHYNVLGTSATN
jgi:hypothetical protein